MPYAINYDTWTVEEITENDNRKPKFGTMFQA